MQVLINVFLMGGGRRVLSTDLHGLGLGACMRQVLNRQQELANEGPGLAKAPLCASAWLVSKTQPGPTEDWFLGQWFPSGEVFRDPAVADRHPSESLKGFEAELKE